MKLAFIDLETTGLDPRSSEIIDYAVTFAIDRRINPEGLHIIRTETFKVKPKFPVSAEASCVNGFTFEKWKDALSSEDAHWKLMGIVAGNDRGSIRAVGWNIDAFDMPFLRHHHPTFAKYMSYHSVDLMAMGWQKIRHLERPHLSDLVIALEIDTRPFQPQHTALGDVERYIACYQKLMGYPLKEELSEVTDAVRP